MADIRGIVVYIQIAVLVPVPVGQVVGIVESGAHADEQVVFPLEEDQGWIGALAVGIFAVVLIFIVQIQRITVFFHHNCPLIYDTVAPPATGR